MKKQLLLALLLCIMLSCRKDDLGERKEDQPSELQYFVAIINQQRINLSANGQDRKLFNTSNTGIGYSNGTRKEMYDLAVNLPNLGTNSQLKLRLFDFQKGEFLLSGNEDIYDSFGSFLVLVKANPNGKDGLIYTASPNKKPAEIFISDIDFLAGKTVVPWVTGKISATLFNRENAQDSIVIENAQFRVRY